MLMNLTMASMMGGIMGIISVVVTQNVFDSQDTATWSTLTITMVELIPAALAISTLVGVFMGLTRLRT